MELLPVADIAAGMKTPVHHPVPIQENVLDVWKVVGAMLAHRVYNCIPTAVPKRFWKTLTRRNFCEERHAIFFEPVRRFSRRHQRTPTHYPPIGGAAGFLRTRRH